MRRYYTGLILAFVASLVPFAGADEPNPAIAVIDTAVTAHGGLANLMKTQKMSRKAVGIMSFFGQDVPFNDEMVLQLPDRSRWTLEGGPSGQKSRFVLVYRGDKAWQSAGGMVTEVNKERLQEIRDEVYVLWVASLVPLKMEKGFSFIALADSKVNGRDVAPVLVSRLGQGDLKLSFDKATGLLVKIDRKGKEAGIPIDKEYFYLDYRTVEGVKLPSKYVEHSNGKKVVDVSSISYRFLSSIDSATFEKP